METEKNRYLVRQVGESQWFYSETYCFSSNLEKRRKRWNRVRLEIFAKWATKKSNNNE